MASLLVAAALPVLLPACSPAPPKDGMQVGMDRSQVRSALGEADEVGDFEMPAGGFFGPQEALTGLVAPGERVEQWEYRHDGELTYVWFGGVAGEKREAWTVIAWTTVPADAVY